MEESTIKNIGFNTSVNTGTRRAESTGQGLARILTAGAETAQSILNTNRVAEDRARAQENRDRAAKARTEKENSELDFIENLNYTTSYNEWMKEKDYANLTSEQQTAFNTEFDLAKGPNYSTERYKANHNKYESARNLKVNELSQVEQDVSVNELSKGTYRENTSLSLVELNGQLENLKTTSKKFKNTDHYKNMVVVAGELIMGNPEKYSPMSADDVIDEMSGLKHIKDKKITKPFDDYIADKRINKLASSDLYLDIDAVSSVASKTSLYPYQVQEKIEKINKAKLPMLLDGSPADIAQAVDIYDSYGMDSKVFEEKNRAMLNQGNIQFYNYTKDKVAYKDATVAEVASLEFIAGYYNLDMTKADSIDIAQDIQKESKVMKVKTTDEEFEDAVTAGINNPNKAEYFRTNLETAKHLARTSDEAFQILENMFSKQEVSGVAVKAIGIFNEEDMDMVLKYAHKDISGDSVANIRQFHGAYELTRRDDRGVETREMMSRNKAIAFVNDAREMNEAFNASVALANGDFSNLNRRIIKDVKVAESILTNRANEVIDEFGSKLSDADKEMIHLMLREKYKGEIAKIAGRNDTTILEDTTAIYEKFKDKVSGGNTRGFGEIKEVFNSVIDNTFGTNLSEGKVSKWKHERKIQRAMYKPNKKKKTYTNAEARKAFSNPYVDSIREETDENKFYNNRMESKFWNKQQQEWEYFDDLGNHYTVTEGL